VVILEENTPIAKVNGDFLLASGFIVKGRSAQQEPKESLLNIKIKKLVDMDNSDLMELSKKLIKVQALFNKAQFLVERISLDQSNSWNVETKNGLLIKVGRKSQLERIERLLQVYVAIENKDRLKSIDLRYRNGLAVELISEPNLDKIKS